MDTILKAQPTKKDEQRFWSRCRKTDSCWLWERGVSADGYGKFSFKRGKTVITCRAHRLSFFFSNGRINENLLICHKCDNPICINPNHLFEGSVKDNFLDAQKKNRIVISRGEQLSDLTEQQVSSIRDRVKRGESQIKIAKEFQIGKNAIWHIVHRTTWKHL